MIEARNNRSNREFIGTFELYLKDGRNIYVTGEPNHGLFAEYKGDHTNNDDARRRFDVYQTEDGLVELNLKDGRSIYVTANSGHELFAEYKGAHTNNDDARRRFESKKVEDLSGSFDSCVSSGFFELYVSDGRSVYVTKEPNHGLFAEYKGDHTNTNDKDGDHRRRFEFIKI